MRHAHFRLLLAATLCVSGGTAEARTGPAAEAERAAAAENPPAETALAETAASLNELLDALGLDALAVDVFLKIDGIDGESTARGGHEDWIEIESFSWVESRPSGGTGQGRRRSSASFSDVSVVKKVDAASPNLYLACASGKHYPTAVLEVRKAGSRESYFTIWHQYNKRARQSTGVGSTTNVAGTVPSGMPAGQPQTSKQKEPLAPVLS